MPSFCFVSDCGGEGTRGPFLLPINCTLKLLVCSQPQQAILAVPNHMLLFSLFVSLSQGLKVAPNDLELVASASCELSYRHALTGSALGIFFFFFQKMK